MSDKKILIVDDDLGIREQLKWALKEDYIIETAENESEVSETFRNNSDIGIVLLDVCLYEEKEGLDVLNKILSYDGSVKIIMITGRQEKELALEAIGKGAFDFLNKPLDIEELKIIIKRASYIRELELENKRLLKEKMQGEKGFGEMLGSCPQMLSIYRTIEKVAPTDATALITGESGTGKELVAKAIHRLSSRKDNSFIVINCGAIPETLLESELFGHEKGSFTGAISRKIGKFELANKGTIFLDEIGELSLNLQAKLLRFLQERVIERVGGNELINLDVRIISATNSNLEEEIKKGGFREDLYYRLSVVTIHLPSLRERGEDILLLANYFLEKSSQKLGKKKKFSKKTLRTIMNYSWPGNIRELENRIERAVILSENIYIEPEELGIDEKGLRMQGLSGLTLKEARESLEKMLVEDALEKSQGNISLASEKLGIARSTLYDLMHKYNLS
jgi:two-component system NtrC family response regulator